MKTIISICVIALVVSISGCKKNANIPSSIVGTWIVGVQESIRLNADGTWGICYGGPQGPCTSASTWRYNVAGSNIVFEFNSNSCTSATYAYQIFNSINATMMTLAHTAGTGTCYSDLLSGTFTRQ